VSASRAVTDRPLIDVRAPADQEEGSQSQVLRWLKSIGERVEEDEPLIEIETDKVTVELASPAAGVLVEILKREEEEIAPGEVLARIAIGEPASAPASRAERPLARPPAEPQVHRGESAHVAPAPAPSRRDLSPAVERLITERGLDPAAIEGTGPGGRVTVDDVLRAAPASHAAAARRVPHTPVRRRIAEHMVQSLLHTAPHVTTVFEADLAAVLAHRARHREDFARRGVQLTLTAYFLSACVDAIRAVPEANARWTEDALELLEPIHIGVGTAVEDEGLIVPVLRRVEALDLLEIARELGRLVALAREGRLAPADVRGGTFTVSNHGVSGSLLAAPIVIHQPQVAILGVGRLEKRAVVVEDSDEDRVIVRPRCYVTLTIDHRAMDGQRANRFLSVLTERLADWPLE
jgi:2-oxoglutarate dehydrogenase E2 component (dihydrolipoamide succinyltransferase)